jgi:hypothetical protein
MFTRQSRKQVALNIVMEKTLARLALNIEMVSDGKNHSPDWRVG